MPAPGHSGRIGHSGAIGLHPGGCEQTGPWPLSNASPAAIAAILVREGVDYAQSKAVFKAARERAGLRAAPGTSRRRRSADS